MKCPLPSRCWIVKSSLTILTTITHLGETDGGRKGSQWRPRLQVGPFRGCGSAPPPSRMPLPLKKKRKKSNYSPSLTNPAGERHKLGPVKTKTCSHENCSQPAPVASPSLWGRDEAEGTTNAFRGGLTHFRRGCREKKKKTSRDVQLCKAWALCALFHDAMSPTDRHNTAHCDTPLQHAAIPHCSGTRCSDSHHLLTDWTWCGGLLRTISANQNLHRPTEERRGPWV